LRRSEENYRSIVENALEGIVRISHAGRVIAANPALPRMLGYASPDEMIAARAVKAELVRANMRARDAQLSALPSPDAVTGYETELHGKEGRLIWVVLSSRLVRDASGEPIYTETFITDLTERKRADQERQDHLWFLESMEKVNLAIQGTNDLEQMTSDALNAVLSIFACDRAWLVYPCDPEAPSWRAVMEHTQPDYPGVLALGIDMPIDAEVANVFQTARASSGVVQFGSEANCPVPAQLAERFSIQSFIAMAVYPKVEKPYLFGLHQCSYPRIWTACEQRLFQEVGRRLGDGLTGLLMLRSLRESEAKLEEAQRIAHVGYWDRDLDTNFVHWSNESLRIFGLPQQNGGVAFTRYPELLHPDDRQRVVSAVAEALRGGARYDVEYRVVQPSGEVRIVHSQGDVVRDGAGRPRRMFGIVQDITERRHVEEALRDVQADLARVARLTTLGELAASLAHEINQPLAAIALNAASGMRWLNQDAPNLDGARAALARIERDGGRASDVLRGLRALAQKSGLQLTRLDIRDAIEEVLVLTRGELQRHRVVLRTDLSAGAQPVLGDRVQLQQVLLNLIWNGIQAMATVAERKRELTVSIAPAAPGHMQVTVEDTGPGLDPAIAQRIFEPFFTTKSDGLGMGLSICRSIINAHGGQLGCSSHEPHGAVFYFTIPIALRCSSAAA
jgi:PAS domain S-box-containing protein